MGVAQGIRAGQAFVELALNDSKFSRALDDAKGKLRGFAGAMGSIGAKSAGAGAALTAPLGKALSDAIGKGAQIKKIAQQYGESTDTISSLAGAFSIAGSDMDTFAGSLDGLKEKIKAAADGNTELVEGLRGLGGRALIEMPLEKQLEVIADKIKSIKKESDRASVVNGLFGGAGPGLQKHLKEGAAGLAALRAEGKKAGEVMSADDIERSAEASKALNLIWIELKNTVVALGSALLPTTGETKSLTDTVREAFAAARAWIAENKNLIIAVAGIGVGLVAAGVAFVAFKALILAGLAVISGGFTALGLLLSPAGLVLAGIAGAATAFLTLTDTGKSMTSTLGEGFRGMGATFSESWGTIVDLVKAGDFQGAFKVAGAGIKAIWAELMVTLRKGWNEFMKGLVDTLRNNPWILPLIGGLVGGATAGPGGAIAGAAAGLGAAAGIEVFADKIVNAIQLDTKAADQRAKEAKNELHALIQGKRGELNEKAALEGEAADKARMESYGKGSWKGVGDAAVSAFDKQKGVFSGPIGQQLGVGDQIGKRQLDVMKDMKVGQKEMITAVINLGKNVAMFGR